MHYYNTLVERETNNKRPDKKWDKDQEVIQEQKQDLAPVKKDKLDIEGKSLGELKTEDNAESKEYCQKRNDSPIIS